MKALLKKLMCSAMVSLFFIFPFSAYAMLPVIDAGAIAQLVSQLQELEQETANTKQALDALKQLGAGQYQWSNAQGLINQLGNIVEQSNGIAYNASDLNQKFQQAYPGYQAPQNYSEQYKNNVNMTENTLNGILQSMGSSANDFQSENARLHFLQAQAQSAQGQTQAIQASAQIASEMVSQIQLLRQTVIAQSNAEAAYYATTVQNEASQKAELEKVINAGSTNVPAYGSSGHALKSPHF